MSENTKFGSRVRQNVGVFMVHPRSGERGYEFSDKAWP